MKNSIARNKFDIKANIIEKLFIKRIRKQGQFFTTGNGHINSIQEVSSNSICIQSQKSTKDYKISRNKIKKAIAYVLYKRTATRKDLESFSAFNSALMGLLRVILIDIARIHHTAKGLLRLTIRGCRFFFSGLDRPSRMDFQAVIHNGGTFILNSYFYLRQKGNNLDEWMKKLEAAGLKLLVDSGAFTLFNAQKKGKTVLDEKSFNLYKKQKRKDIVQEITVNEFAAFINKYKHLIYGYFNLDVIGDAKTSDSNFQKLKQLTGTSPIPVWHCNAEDWKKSDWEELDKMVEEDFEIIALGGTVELGKRGGVHRQNQVKRELFTEVFNRHKDQNFHWLGGSSGLLFEFPFFSADSSGWLEGRKKNQIYSYESKEASTRIASEWTAEQCLSYNVKTLSSLERLYEGVQLDLDLVITL